jgi:Fe-S-cluster containining protein
MMARDKGGAQTHCIRCGTCCLKGGPTLHSEDASLFARGILKREEVYTLRRGEVVRDTDDNPMVLQEEMIKIKGEGRGWSCVFYDEEFRECGIYDARPAECRALKCWDLKDIKEVMARPLLQRRDLLDPDDDLLKIVAAHERKCSYGILESAVRDLMGPHPENAVEIVLELLHYDHYLRPLVTERLKVPASTLDFLLGRPLTVTIAMFGLMVRQEDGDFILMPATSAHS